MNNVNKEMIIKGTSLIVIFLIIYGIFSYEIGEIFSSFIYYISVLMIGLTGSIVIAIIAPALAYLFNILGPGSQVLFPLLIANILLIVIFDYFYKRYDITGIILGVFVGSIVRSIPITITVNYIVEISDELRPVLGFPQFFSAFLGGILFLLVYVILKKTNKLPQS